MAGQIHRRVLLVDQNGDPYVASGGGGGPATIANGADVNAGATTDAAVLGDSAGTISAKLRGLSRILNDVWDDAGNLLRVGGAAASGTPKTGNPVLVGLDNGTNVVNWGDTGGANFTTGAGIGVILPSMFNGSTYTTFRNSTNQDGANTATLACGMMTFDGTNHRRARDANAAAGTTGTGLLGAGGMVFDGTNWQSMRSAFGLADATGFNGGVASATWGYNGANYDRIRTANAASNTTGTGLAGIGSLFFDETNWQLGRGNTDATVLTSASRTTTQTVTFTNYNSTYLRVVLDMTVVGTGSVTLSIDVLDTVSGKWVNLLTGVAVTTNITSVYEIGPSLTAVANGTANKALSRNMRIVVTANNANAAVYSVGRQLTGQ